MEVSLMDTLHSYFVYSVTTLCGFPSITLEGTTSDWQQLRGRAQHLPAYDLDWSIPSLLPVLDQFVLASQNQPDKTFWCDFYKLAHFGSGDRRIQGHILNLFPYLGRKRPSNAQLVADYETFIRGGARRTEAQVQAELAPLKSSLERGESNPEGSDTLRRNPFIGKGPLKPHEGITTGAVIDQDEQRTNDLGLFPVPATRWNCWLDLSVPRKTGRHWPSARQLVGPCVRG